MHCPLQLSWGIAPRALRITAGVGFISFGIAPSTLVSRNCCGSAGAVSKNLVGVAFLLADDRIVFDIVALYLRRSYRRPDCGAPYNELRVPEYSFILKPWEAKPHHTI